MRRVVVLDDCYVDRLAIETVFATDQWVVETCQRSMQFHLRVLSADTDVWIVNYELSGRETGLQVISNLRCAGVKRAPVIMLSRDSAVEEMCDPGANIFFLNKDNMQMIPEVADQVLSTAQQPSMQTSSAGVFL